MQLSIYFFLGLHDVGRGADIAGFEPHRLTSQAGRLVAVYWLQTPIYRKISLLVRHLFSLYPYTCRAKKLSSPRDAQ